MSEATPAPGGSEDPDTGCPALLALRAASDRVAALDAPALDAPGLDVPAPDVPAPDVETGPDGLDPSFDPADHAERFETLHEALTAVLVDLDHV